MRNRIRSDRGGISAEVVALTFVFMLAGVALIVVVMKIHG